MRIYKTGWHHSTETRMKIRLNQSGTRSGMWKGAKASYKAIHQWVQNWFGKPERCEHCGRDGLTGRKIHWANISGHYIRERGDWLRLCQPCHSKFDGIAGGTRA